MVLISRAFSAAQVQTNTEDEVLRYAKSIDVAKLDSTLPSQPLEEWLLRGPARIDEVTWRISLDCDLKDPQPDAEGNLPLCVRIAFRRGNITGLGLLRVGTRKSGIKGQPAFQYPLGVLFPFSVGDYDKLSELPRYLDGIPQFGTVCILPIASEREHKVSSVEDYNPATLKLRIDKRQELVWPHERPVKIEPFSLKEKHVVAVTSDKKEIQSFRFDFIDYWDAKLCLAFDGPQLAHVESHRSASWCNCE